MTRYNFRIDLSRLTAEGILKEASKEECRVLLALASLFGKADAQTLSDICGVSVNRVLASVAFWQSSGVLLPQDEPIITEEFTEMHYEGEILEEDGKSVAKGIRDNKLAEVIEAYAELMNKPVASPLEVKRITALATQYGLSAEYIMVYMAHLAERGALTSAARLCSGAIKLAENGIDTVEALEAHLEAVERDKKEYNEIKKLLGIFGRSLSKSEVEFFSRWCHEYGFDIAIIGEAYDITVVNTGKVQLQYMDKILTDWHIAGAKTLEDCQRIQDAEKEKRAVPASAEVKKADTQRKQKPRYGDFDPEAALRNAIDRSFADGDKDDGDEEN